jgi:hypothetical protein
MSANAFIVPDEVEEAASSKLGDGGIFYESLELSATSRTPVNLGVLTAWLLVEKWNVRRREVMTEAC